MKVYPELTSLVPLDYTYVVCEHYRPHLLLFDTELIAKSRSSFYRRSIRPNLRPPRPPNPLPFLPLLRLRDVDHHQSATLRSQPPPRTTFE